MNDLNIIKSKINKCNSINNNKVDFSVWKKVLYEKVLVIAKLLYKKNEELDKIDEDQKVKDKGEVDTIRSELENIRNDNNIVEITSDPLIEFNKINEYDKKLMVFNERLKSQIKNNKIQTQIDSTEAQVEQLFEKLASASS